MDIHGAVVLNFEVMEKKSALVSLLMIPISCCLSQIFDANGDGFLAGWTVFGRPTTTGFENKYAWLHSPENSTAATLVFNTTSFGCQIQVQNTTEITELRAAPVLWSSPCGFLRTESLESLRCNVRFTVGESLQLEVEDRVAWSTNTSYSGRNNGDVRLTDSGVVSIVDTSGRTVWTSSTVLRSDSCLDIAETAAPAPSSGVSTVLDRGFLSGTVILASLALI